MNIRIATRESALALAQTKMVADYIGVPYELVGMTTEGDRCLDKSLLSFEGKGVFVKELEIALLEERVDIAVHSLKDMPAQVLPEFKLAAVLKREDPRDAFISKERIKFMDLPSGASVGTGSVRRLVQLKALRPDLKYVPIRGNIQTRISKLKDLDGIVLAAAGLNRMDLSDQVTEFFTTNDVLPASGQGILAIETLSKSKNPKAEQINRILAEVNDVETYCIAVAEMSYLKTLNAGCQFPVAAYAEFNKNEFSERIMKIRGIYFEESSQRMLKVEESENFTNKIEFNSSVEKAQLLGIKLAESIKKQLIF